MGPDTADLPSCPRFSWDARCVPWTDGKGNQEEYARAVRMWRTFHNKLPDGHAAKILPSLQGIMLQSQLFGRARDLCMKIGSDIIESDDGPDAIVNAIHKRDELAVVSEVYNDFLELLNTKRGSSESFRNFERRFEAKTSKFNSNAATTKLPESLVAFMLLANSAVDSNQRISVLASSAPRDARLTPASTTDDFLQALSYESIASVIRQCDKPKGQVSDLAMHAHATNMPIQKKKLSPRELADLKSKSRCRKCKKIGHWAIDHSTDPDLASSSSRPDPSFHPRNDKPKSSSLTFNMARIAPAVDESPLHYAGPLVDNAAPYSGLGVDEFHVIQPIVHPNWSGSLDPLPLAIADRPYWQYGSGLHSSDSRKIIGSVFLTMRTNDGNTVDIRHLVIEGSSPWVIGRNIVRNCNILYDDRNILQLPIRSSSGDKDFVPMIDDDMHSYISYSMFINDDVKLSTRVHTSFFCATAQLPTEDKSTRSISKQISLVDMVHRHVCGHSSYGDIKTLLVRNGLWNNDTKRYIAQVVETCNSCRHTSQPSQARKVSLSSMCRDFNQVVCVDHLFLENMCVFHAMDSVTRYSVGTVVPDTSMNHAVRAFDAHWLSTFWSPEKVLFDPGFKGSDFTKYLQELGIMIAPLPARRHNKNVIESKHRILRDIFLRLKAENEDTDVALLIQQSFRISNNLYGNNVLSAHELAKGYTRPVTPGASIIRVPEELDQAQQKLQARRKLSLILQSKATAVPPVHVGDLVEVFIKRSNEKSGKWSSPKAVLSFDQQHQTVSLPGKNGRVIHAAVEDIRPAITDSPLAVEVQTTLDELDSEIECGMTGLEDPDEGNVTRAVQSKHDSDFDLSEGMSIRHDTSTHTASTPGSANPIGKTPAHTNKNDSLTSISVGDKVAVFWPDDEKYYSGTVSKFFPRSGKHKIVYEDGQCETLDMDTEIWRHDSIGQSTSLSTNEIQVVPGIELTSQEREATQQYYQRFNTKEFLLNDAQDLPSFVTQNAYEREEDSFMKTVQEVHVSEVPTSSNIISSHVLYKVKTLDDGSRLVKARIAPHGNKDRDKHLLRTDSATCPPVGLRILLSFCTIFHWCLVKLDVKSAFLQSGAAHRNVYVVPPRECKKRMFYWLLLTASYGLANANAKWQDHSDQFLFQIGFLQLAYVPQVFYLTSNDELKLMAIKVVDDFLFAGRRQDLQKLVQRTSQKYELGTIVYSPGTFKFYGIDILHDEDGSITLSGDEKLLSIETLVIDRMRRKQQNDTLNKIELTTFRSLNGSIGWLGVTASPFCSFASSYMQQKGSNPSVHDLVSQQNMLKTLKQLGSKISYKRHKSGTTVKPSLLVFSHASVPSETGQLGFIAGLLFGELRQDSIIHVLHWSSAKSRRPVRSTGAAETLAAGISIDEGKILVKAYETLPQMPIDLILCVDSKDLFDTLSTCHGATDKSIRGDVAVIRYEFETQRVNKIVWIPGKCNLSDPLTKWNSPLTQPLQLLMYTGEMPLSFPDAQTRKSDQPLG